MVSNCCIDGGDVGIQFTQSTGIVEGSTIWDCSVCSLAIITYSTVDLVDNIISGGGNNIVTYNYCIISGTGNDFAGSNSGTIRNDGGILSLHGNHILNAGGYSVSLEGYFDPGTVLDFSNNYWGTSDPDQISEWIIDGHDDPGVAAVVDFEPFATHPIDAEQKSWGEVKNLYR